jgi:hypothetical protein|tara:strand:- start:1378 stop:1989 length:612 start_codon:yes stop_codon:yes gene_type:complete
MTIQHTMFDDVIVIDDAIPKSYQNHMAEIIKCDDFSWYWQNEVAEYGANTGDKINDTWESCYGLFHILYSAHTHQRSSFYDIFYPMIGMICDAAENPFLSTLTIQRVRSGLITRGSVSSGKHHIPHVDFPKFKHTTILYYPVNSDGETYMFDKIVGKENEGSSNFIKIEPKQGRAIVFNGQRYHASSSPTNNDFRAVININLC